MKSKKEYPKEIQDIDERYFRQAYQTLFDNIKTILSSNNHRNFTLNAFNQSINQDGFCPTLTTRPEGFKTSILVIEKVGVYSE